MTRISVIGLGKLGACSAACFAYKGFETIGVDINKDFVDSINSGQAPVQEPRLQELIDVCKYRLRATQHYGIALKETDITILIVPTPSREDGQFSNKYLKGALKELSKALRHVKKEHHLFVITSTVSPGSTEKELIPLIESVSGKKLNKGFGVCYNPEFIALGSVITDFLNPDMVLIGESDKRAGDKLEKVYKNLCESDPYIARMSIISAEITKISLNSYVTMKISFANTLANICEAIPGANVDHITKALGEDKRVSPYYLKGALSYGGPCFPRDNRAFTSFASKYGVDALLPKATDEVNQIQVSRLTERITGQIGNSNNAIISVLGLAYKPDTSVIEESAAIRLIEELLKKDLEVIVYDPLAMDNTRAYFGDNILYAASVKDCLSNASVCIITLPYDEFKLTSDSLLTENLSTVIDCWRIVDAAKLPERIRYVGLGISAGE